MKKLLIFALVLVSASAIFAAKESITAKLDLTNATTSGQIGFAKDAVTIDDITKSNSDKLYGDNAEIVLTPHTSTGIASLDDSKNKLYIYALINSKDTQTVTISVEAMDGYASSAKTGQRVEGELDWTVKSAEDLNSTFTVNTAADASGNNATVFTHNGVGEGTGEFSKLYCTKVAIETADFRNKSNYFEGTITISCEGI